MTMPPEPPQDPQQPYGQQPPPPQYGQQPGYYTGPQQPWGQDPTAPWGRHPATGEPYSDKSKLVAGLLQLLVPLGIGRFYLGYTGLGVGQLLVTIFTCGIGAIWPFIDGILILVGNVRDPEGRPLKD